MKTQPNPTRSRLSSAFLPAVLTLCLCGATPARAQVLEYEGFDYAGTALHGQNGGTGWGGMWTNSDGNFTLSNDGLSLSYPASVGHVPTGSRISMTAQGMAERVLGTAVPLNTEGDTFYVSVLVRRQGGVGFDFVDNVATPRIRWHFGGNTNAPDSVVAVDPGATAQRAVGADLFPLNETVYVIAKIITHNPAPANDVVFLNTYRSTDTVPAAEPTTWQITANGNSGLVLTRFRIRNLEALPLEVDEIRIGRDWSSVSGAIAAGPPVITKQPVSQAVYAGSTVQLSVEANGALPLSYQWYKGAQALLNQTNTLLTLTNFQAADAGVYSVIVSNSVGVTNSDPATLSVIEYTNITVGLVALWHFDEPTGLTAFDATTNHNDGTLFNYAGDDSQWIPSDYNGALRFNRAASNYVEVPHHPSIGANLASRFSVAAWIRSRVDLTAGGSTYRCLEKGDTFFLLQGTGASGGMNLLVKKNAANITAGIGETLLAERWYHLAGTYDGTTLRVYLDGVLKSSVPVAAPIDTTTQPLRIGSDYVVNSPGARFDGDMDEVGIWERPLQESEILELSGNFGPPTLLEQPEPQTKYAGSSATFRVRARGQQPLRYLWYHGTNEIRTATNNVLTLYNIQASDAGDYHCQIANDLGQTNSQSAALTVVPVTSLADANEALWKFDDSTGLTAADASANARHGQLQNYPGDDSQWIAGQVGGALSFDGQTNRVVVPGGSSLNLGTDASFAFWLRPTAYGTVVDHGNYLSYHSRALVKPGQFDVEVVDDPGSVRATLRVNGIPAPQNILALNQWQHFAVTFSGGRVTFYKNGFQVGDSVPGSLGASNANAVVLGTITDGVASNNWFQGAMDEVGIWSRTLSETEILSLAGRDVAGAPVIVTQPQSATRYVGGSVTFVVEATGKRPLTYLWAQDGSPLPNSNTNRLVLTNLTAAQAGNYVVTVSNDLGVAVSAPPATLVVQEITNVATGLIAYWPMDETNGTVLNDASGRGHHAALQNAAAVPGVVGMIRGAFNFDGVNDFAVVPHHPDLNMFNQMSISVWIYPRTLAQPNTGGLGRMIRKDINYDFTTYDVDLNGVGTLRVYGYNKAAYDAPANVLTANEWQHVAVVVKDGTIQFFKNGRSLAEPVPALLGPAVTNDLVIANFGPDLSISRLFNGYMDDLGLWERALTVDEIDGIYQNGLIGKPLNAPFDPFRIYTIDFPSPTQVRLVFFTPHTGREHVVQRNHEPVGPNWVDQTPVTFTALGGGFMEAVFDKVAGAAVFYRVGAQPQGPIFFDNFETFGPGWTHGAYPGWAGDWAVGTPIAGPGAAYSGTNVYAVSLAGTPEPYSDCYLRSPVIDLTGVSRATLKYWQWRDIYPDTAFHSANVRILDPTTFSVLHEFAPEAGATSGYEQRVLPLPPQLLGRTILVEFRLITDIQVLPTEEGWFIDDVTIVPE